MPALLVASAAILIASVIVALHLTPRGSVAFLLNVALLAMTFVAATIAIAGLLLRDFSAPVLLGLAVVWPVGSAVIGLRVRRTPVRWQERLAATLPTVREAVTDPPVALAAVLVLGTLAWRTFLATRLPVVDYDGWSYHLVFVDVWLQNDALTLVPQREWTSGYPAVMEFLTTWLAAFTRTDALTGFVSVLPIPAAIAATTGLARFLGADRRRALLVGLLLGMTPAIVALAGTTYIDTASVAAVTATWWLGLRVIRGERDRSAALLLGIAGGLAFGAKGTNILLVTPILAVASLVLARELLDRWRGDRTIGSVVVRLALFAVPILLLGGSWYIKNLVVHANPLYPFAVGPFEGPNPLDILVWAPPELEGLGSMDQMLRSWAADWGLDRYVYNVRPGGLGRAWLAIVPIALAGMVVLLRQRRSFAVFGLVALPTLVTLLTAPNPWYARYTLFLPALALPFAAVAIDRLRPRLATLAGLGLVGLAAISLVFVNIRPNIDIRAGIPGSGRPPTPRQYLGFVLDPSEARRSQVGLRASCEGFGIIPAGERVVPGGFNLLHAAVGPNLDRILTDPIGGADDQAALVAAMRERGANWLVTGLANELARVAESAPETFVAHGEICQGARLWQLADPS